MSAQAQPLITLEQYLALERASEQRHEFYRGRMYAMSGASYRHGRIVTNIASDLDTRLDGRPCDVLTQDLRTMAGELVTYPDLVVVCGEPHFHDQPQDTLLNPLIIVEVLSPSTEGYDRGLKARQYRSIPGLKELVFVAQNVAHVEVHRATESGQWVLTEYHGLEAICRFESLGCELPLARIYRRVAFDSDDD